MDEITPGTRLSAQRSWVKGESHSRLPWDETDMSVSVVSLFAYHQELRFRNCASLVVELASRDQGVACSLDRQALPAWPVVNRISFENF
jgi:hypothetical protein